jgi:hypothetical protein
MYHRDKKLRISSDGHSRNMARHAYEQRARVPPRQSLAATSKHTSTAAAPELTGLVAGFPLRRPGFEPRSGHMGFVVDRMALGQVLSGYSCFPC